MKINKFNTVSILLLLAFFNAFSSAAFSYPSEDLNLDSRNFDYLQADQNKNAVFIEIANVSSSYEQNSSNNFLSGGNLPGFLISLKELNRHFSQITSWHYLRDDRQLLSQHIFPFQFFW